MEKLELLHADLCGPISPPMPRGKCYFLLLVDDHSRFMWLVRLSMKDEAEPAIRPVKAAAELQGNCKLRTLRTDRGDEFTPQTFDELCANNGIQRHLSAPYSLQQNGVVSDATRTWWPWRGACSKCRMCQTLFGGRQ